MFIQEEELKSVIYEYQLLQIVEADHDIVLMAIGAAEEEVRSYLEANNQIRFQDGRPLLDLNAIMTASGANRNALLVAHCKTIAVWHLIQLCNADVIYEHRKERYDRAINWLKDLGSGTVNLGSLPTLDPEDPTNPNNKAPFSMGSRKKFNHE
jgi:phage gp36-like protein